MLFKFHYDIILTPKVRKKVNIMNMKEMVISDLIQLSQMDMCDPNIIESVKNGDFDEDINDMDNMKVHEISDQIMLLYRIKSKKVS